MMGSIRKQYITMSLSLMSGPGRGSIWKETVTNRTHVEIRKVAARKARTESG